MKKTNNARVDTTRRKFLANSAAVVAVVGTTSNVLASAVPEIQSIRIPKEIPASLAEAPKPGSFEGNGMTGAEVFARLCKEEELAALFCCPGNYTVINAIAAAGIPAYGGRTEGAMCAAADGFSRVTGEVTATSGTVGPQAAWKGAPVLTITSDAGAAYSLFELDTAMKFKIPTITLIYNNNSWGMWPSAATSARSMHMYLFQENLRYDKMAEGLGARGEYVQTPEQLREALKRSYQAAAKESLSTVINVQALKEFTSARHYPPGVALNPEPGVGAFAH